MHPGDTAPHSTQSKSIIGENHHDFHATFATWPSKSRDETMVFFCSTETWNFASVNSSQ